jgi:hypothetical protein
MKAKLIALLLLATTLHAHERITLGPKGGRLIAIDSPATPNAEFSVTKDNRFQIAILDKDRKPLPVGERKLTVTAGDRSDPKKLTTEIKDDVFLTEAAPSGKDYYVIMQLREPDAAKGKTFRLHYNQAECGECKKAEWLCSCGMKTSGKNIEVPAALDGLWAEINQHTKELREGTAGKAYEAIDEVTEAFPVLASALPSKTEAAKQTDATKLVGDLKASLASIRNAFAARTPEDAKPHLDAVEKTLTGLKSLYPAAVANAQLKE